MESSLTNAVPESPAEKGLTAEEEKDLDTIMQSLDIDSSGSDIDENEDLGARDFTEEFGLSPVSFDHSSQSKCFHSYEPTLYSPNKHIKNNNCDPLRTTPPSVHSSACTHSTPSTPHTPSSHLQDTKPSSAASDGSASAAGRATPS